jgi:soluble lytic murein transglycosylase-like protein
MGNAADTLVSKHPTRIAQLRGPVFDYLKAVSKNMPFNGTDQDLYMAVFYPAYRRKPVNAELPAIVQKWNPGIKTSGDYIALVNKQKLTAQLTHAEWTELKKTASALGMTWEPLYKQIHFESRWDPKARNPKSGARGLIQFIPSTAEAMGYKGGMGIGSILLAVCVSYMAAKAVKII